MQNDIPYPTANSQWKSYALNFVHYTQKSILIAYDVKSDDKNEMGYNNRQSRVEENWQLY